MNGDGVDICGIILYSLFFLLVAVRISPFFGDDRLSSTDRIKLAFHCTLLGYSLLEIVHYAIALAYHEPALSGYACHLVALWLSLVAFSLVIVLWSTTLHPPRGVATGVSTAGAEGSRRFSCRGIRLSGTTKFVIVIDTVVAATTVAVLWTGTVPVHSRTYLILVVAHSVTLFLLASWLVLYGVRLQRRVMNHPRWEPLDRRQRLKILCRINGVLVVCAVCFLIRVAVLSSALCSRLWHRAEQMDRLSFELLAKWVSGLVPGVALLHIMCKTRKPGDESGTRQQVRMNSMQEDQSLKEPLLASREGTGGNLGLGREEEGHAGNARSHRGVMPSSKNDRSGHATRSGGPNDAFVYHVVRAQGTRTDTTI